ncbi:tetratricopeptide repeat protein [Clostridium cellulovorans]|uniref:TPR repeat-containing protein n=1 Tax=Clostridium cellulovorans (strain ATCC 35296 / DSM 3052 / OCM 3 / 743B) TaxID=573061 RepID=D9SR82_CLOC7|nr:tetratricopeptide repeat protein [Clostridium cellulovorans]ADL50370.1 TPR repeat-containing protein [Clostridium cellulovorans 743B]
MSKQKLLTLLSVIISLPIFLFYSKIIGVLIFILLLIYTNFPSILMYRANLHYTQKNMHKALSLYKLAYSSWHAPDKMKISYGYLLIRMGNLEESDAVLSKFKNKTLNPTDKLSWKLNYSLVLWKKNKLDEAINLLMEEYNQKKNTTLYQNLGYFLLLNKDYDKALEFNLEAYEYNDSDASILDNLAQSYYFKGQYSKALEIYDKLIPMTPTFVTAYYYYAMTLSKESRTEEALGMLNKALECNFSYLSNVSKEDVEKSIYGINSI